MTDMPSRLEGPLSQAALHELLDHGPLSLLPSLLHANRGISQQRTCSMQGTSIMCNSFMKACIYRTKLNYVYALTKKRAILSFLLFTFSNISLIAEGSQTIGVNDLIVSLSINVNNHIFCSIEAHFFTITKYKNIE